MSKDKRLQDAMKFFAELATNGGNIDTMEKLNYIRLCWNSAIDMQAEIDRLNKNLRLLLCKTHLDKCDAGLFNSKNPDDEPCLICLMNAAERGE